MATASPATSIDSSVLTQSTKTAIERIVVYNDALEALSADHAAVVAAVAKYNAARQKAIVARDAALEAMLSVSSTASNLHETHFGEELPPEIEIGGEPSAESGEPEEEITPEPAVFRANQLRVKAKRRPVEFVDIMPADEEQELSGIVGEIENAIGSEAIDPTDAR